MYLQYKGNVILPNGLSKWVLLGFNKYVASFEYVGTLLGKQSNIDTALIIYNMNNNSNYLHNSWNKHVYIITNQLNRFIYIIDMGCSKIIRKHALRLNNYLVLGIDLESIAVMYQIYLNKHDATNSYLHFTSAISQSDVDPRTSDTQDAPPHSSYCQKDNIARAALPAK